jgi:hypothetical protein
MRRAPETGDDQLRTEPEGAGPFKGVPYVIVNRGATGQDSLPEVPLRLEGDVVEIFPKAVREALG